MPPEETRGREGDLVEKAAATPSSKLIVYPKEKKEAFLKDVKALGGVKGTKQLIPLAHKHRISVTCARTWAIEGGLYVVTFKRRKTIHAFPASFKAKVLAYGRKSGNIAAACRKFKISEATYYNWRRKRIEDIREAKMGKKVAPPGTILREVLSPQDLSVGSQPFVIKSEKGKLPTVSAGQVRFGVFNSLQILSDGDGELHYNLDFTPFSLEVRGTKNIKLLTEQEV